jgi:polyphosphate kinase
VPPEGAERAAGQPGHGPGHFATPRFKPLSELAAVETGLPTVTVAGTAAAPFVSIPRATEPMPIHGRPELDDPRLYFNRELSWLDFNWRVLALAIDERTPLLERVFFLGITASNLDEFVRKRVDGVKRQAAANVRQLSPDGRTPDEQLRLLRVKIKILQERMTDTWEHLVKPLLRERANIRILDHQDLDAEEHRWLRDHFMSHIFPVLTPLAVDPSHPFPFISNQSLSLAVELRHPRFGTEHFARLKVPTGRGRWIALPGVLRFVPVEQVIANNIAELFRGMQIVGVHPFRVTRNADLKRDEEEADDLLELISDELRERRFASAVRLEIDAATPERVRRLLLRELDLETSDVYDIDGLIDLTACHEIAALDFPEHRYAPWEPVKPRRFDPETDEDEADVFRVIREKDVVVHHPYESFVSSVQRFVEAAAIDPQVLAIKQTLYRTSSDSGVVRALIRAADLGKQVAVLVEVRARFDEESNMEWGQQLETAGVHVTYGLVGLKTHCKTTVVVREEADGLRVYCHIGTGNYNTTTARLYTDLGLFTCDPVIGMDVTNLFHFLTGYAPDQQYRELVIAPGYMREMFIAKIRMEVEHQGLHGNGRIMAKMNALDDVAIIQELYRASSAGVQIDLVVRGHCRLRPGLKEISENIRIVSILGRFLEHTRIYYFHNNGVPDVYIGSADWQRRNLDDRVEAIVPVKDAEARVRLIDVLVRAVTEQRQGWDLRSDGTYVQRRPSSPEEAVGFQERLMAEYSR